MARTKTDGRDATATGRAPQVLADGTANVTEHDIARRAYDFYLARGCEHGYDVEDWLQAEREVRTQTHSTAA